MIKPARIGRFSASNDAVYSYRLRDDFLFTAIR